MTRFAGSVSDTAYRPVAGARVEFVGGARSGAFVMTDATGTFLMDGPFVQSDTFRASKAGHVAATRPFNPGSMDFYLASLEPPADIAGDYTLTFIADPACGNLPDEMRTRTYTALVTPAPHPDYIPADTAYQVAVSGAPFLDNYEGFYIGVAGNLLALYFDDGHGTPSLVEQVAAKTYLAFGGFAEATVGQGVSTISTSLDGWIDYCVQTSESGTHFSCNQRVAGAVCQSKNHQLILTR